MWGEPCHHVTVEVQPPLHTNYPRLCPILSESIHETPHDESRNRSSHHILGYRHQSAVRSIPGDRAQTLVAVVSRDPPAHPLRHPDAALVRPRLVVRPVHAGQRCDGPAPRLLVVQPVARTTRSPVGASHVTYRSDKAEGPRAGRETVDPLEFLARVIVRNHQTPRAHGESPE